MVRSLWKRTLITSLAWAGLALGQQTDSSVPATPAARPQRTLTVQEPGKGPIKCKLLQTWKTAEGTKAYQVQAVDGGEMITIVETGSASVGGAQAMATKIYHWGSSATPPAGTPMPPASTVQTVSTAPKNTPKAPVLPTLPTLPPSKPVVTQRPAPAMQPPAPPSGVGMRAVSSPSTVVSTKVLDSTPAASPKSISPVVTSTGATAKVLPTLPSKPVMVSQTKESAPMASKPQEMSKTVLSVAEAREKAAIASSSVEPMTPASTKTDWWTAKKKEQDPLKMPQAYSKVDTASVIKSEEVVTDRKTPFGQPQRGEPKTPQVGQFTGKYLPGQPMGVQSVVAASAHDPQGPVNLPVPTMSLPQRHPVQQQQPAPGAVRQPNEYEVNAFTPPGMPMPASPAAAQQPAVANVPKPPALMPALPVAQAAYSGGTAPRPVVAQSSPTQAEVSRKMIDSLRDAMLPSQREWAAESIAKLDWRDSPEGVGALIQAAKDDPAIHVRTSCIRCLGKMKAKTPAVLNALEALKTDRDSRIREEAERALVCIGK